MRNILEKADRELIAERIDRIQETDRPLWGRMTAHEMLCHVSDIFRMAFGEIAVQDQSTFFTRQIMSKLILLGLPMPKGKIATSPELDQLQGNGTIPTDLRRIRRAFMKRRPSFSPKTPTIASSRMQSSDA